MIAINAGKCCFCDLKPTDGCLGMMGSHYIHHFTWARLCFSLARDPWPADDGVKRASCPGEREPVWLSPGSQLTAPYQEIADTLSNVGEKPELPHCYPLLSLWLTCFKYIYFYQSIKWSQCLVGICEACGRLLVKYLSLGAGLGSSGDMGTLDPGPSRTEADTEVTHAVTMRAVTV